MNIFRIVIIEDSIEDFDLILYQLKKDGLSCECRRVQTKEELRLECNSFCPDIILSDYNLPMFDAMKALALVRSEYCADIPFIVITGVLGDEKAVETLKQGATDYVLKDSLWKLVPAIKRAIEEHTKKKEKLKADEELLIYQEKLKKLTVHIEKLKDEERKAIARQLHDEIGQALTVLMMNTEIIDYKLPPGNPEIKNKLDAMKQLITHTVKIVQKITSDLRPPILDDFGIGAAIDWKIKSYSAISNIKFTVRVSPDDLTLNNDISTVLYHIFLELMTNIFRHSGATAVAVSLTKNENTAVFEISDNGKGITEEAIIAPQSFGIAGIKERVSAFGGTVEFKGIPMTGTTVKINFLLGKS